jgi:type IV pilus assembly protein PilB
MRGILILMEGERNSKTPASLAEALIQKELITEEQLNQALTVREKGEKPLASILVEMNLVTEEDIVWTLARQLKIPYISLTNYLIDPCLFRLIPAHIAIRNALVPISRNGEKLIVAMVDPENVVAIDLIKMITGLTIRPVASTLTDVNNALLEGYGHCPTAAS